MARPKKQEHEKRTASIYADVTQAEKEHFRELVAASGCGSEAEFIRRRALGYAVASTDPIRRADPALITKLNALGLELKAIGNNANQLARAKHTGRSFNVRWQAVADKVIETRDEVSATLARLVQQG